MRAAARSAGAAMCLAALASACVREPPPASSTPARPLTLDLPAELLGLLGAAAFDGLQIGRQDPVSITLEVAFDFRPRERIEVPLAIVHGVEAANEEEQLRHWLGWHFRHARSALHFHPYAAGSRGNGNAFANRRSRQALHFSLMAPRRA